MSERANSYEGISKLEVNNRRFFGTWAEIHVNDPENSQASLSEEHPYQSIDHAITPALAPNEDLDISELEQRIEFVLNFSTKDSRKAGEFLAALQAPYPYEGGNGRSVTQYLVEEYMSQGRSVCLETIHSEGLTDVPTLTALVRLSLIKEYGDKYCDRVSEVASPTLKFQDFMDIYTPDLLSVAGDTVWLPPVTDSAQTVRKLTNMTKEEVDELFGYAAQKGGLELVRIAKGGNVCVISAPGSKATVLKDGDEIKSIVAKTVTQEAANMISRFDAVWPATIVNGSIEFGPILDIARGKGKNRHYTNLQNIEDVVDINTAQVDLIFGRHRVGRYKRQTEPGQLLELSDVKSRYPRLGQIPPQVASMAIRGRLT